ncbi:MAG: ACP S-malonyltransferase, partial [Synergistaceae bacterium]|nr:ACP S-malonyltransferase [Synergistaceae bacterium]
MKKYALVFPGQGSQSVGMGKEIYESFPSAKSVFEEADDALSFNLTRLIFEGPESELTLTKNSQPAIMTMSIAALRVLTDEMNADLNPVCAAGHSLGEYTALVASGVISFWDAVRLVRSRGEFMQEAVPEGKGSMAAVLGLDSEGVKKFCEGIAPNGEIQPANFNSPGQVVISGLSEYIDKAIEHAKEFGARKAVKLNVSAPFHSQYMKPAAEKLKLEFAKISWNQAKYGIIANVSAKPVKAVNDILDS